MCACLGARWNQIGGCQTDFKFQYHHRWHKHGIYVNKYLSCSLPNKLLSHSLCCGRVCQRRRKVARERVAFFIFVCPIVSSTLLLFRSSMVVAVILAMVWCLLLVAFRLFLTGCAGALATSKISFTDLWMLNDAFAYQLGKERMKACHPQIGRFIFFVLLCMCMSPFVLVAFSLLRLLFFFSRLIDKYIRQMQISGVWLSICSTHACFWIRNDAVAGGSFCSLSRIFSVRLRTL